MCSDIQIPKSDCCTVIETGCAKPTTITKAGVVTEPLNTDKSNLSNTYENKAVKISVNSSDIISIESNSFSVHNVPSDGECFFHALSLGTVGNFTNSNMYRLLICQQIYDNFNIYKDQILMCHENIATSQQYQNSMVFGSEYATSCEIGVACRIMNTNINIWLQGRNDKNVICFTKEEYIHSP